MKHYAIMEKLQQNVAKRNLMDISEVEQTLASTESYTEATKQIDLIINKSEYQISDLTRIVMIYALRYEDKDLGTNLNRYLKILSTRDSSEEHIKLLTDILQYAGIKQRSEYLDLFENKVLTDRLRKSIPAVSMGGGNIFTQHKPLLCRIINSLVDGTLPEEGFPFYCKLSQNKIRPQHILLFIVGGITYEEACAVSDFNTKQNLSVILGGSQIHNSESFIKAVSSSAKQTGEKKRKLNLYLNSVSLLLELRVLH